MSASWGSASAHVGRGLGLQESKQGKTREPTEIHQPKHNKVQQETLQEA
jgi:hypothetical protein